ncbi:SAV_915 family protein [Microbispora sp. NPDC049125]|uniref:SAV_915 family protein n=1 Tax=Microbispora sp. NPDC049125 TaxID=3154929 RepID=UPI0034650359
MAEASPHLLFVPVHAGTVTQSLRLFRTAAGKRTAVAFSSPARLMKVLGADQPWTCLTEPVLRGLIADLDVIGVVFDPAGTMPAQPAGHAQSAQPAGYAAEALAGASVRAA